MPGCCDAYISAMEPVASVEPSSITKMCQCSPSTKPDSDCCSSESRQPGRLLSSSRAGISTVSACVDGSSSGCGSSDDGDFLRAAPAGAVPSSRSENSGSGSKGDDSSGRFGSGMRIRIIGSVKTLGTYAAVLLLAVLAGCNRGDHPEQIAQAAPDFTVHNGSQTIHLSQFRGKLVILNFWATWCAPCIDELPSLQELQKERPDIQVLAVSIDDDPAAYSSLPEAVRHQPAERYATVRREPT